MNQMTVYDDYDQTSPSDRIRAAAPAFFVDAMKKYIARNSIKTTAPEFAFYCACTWEAQQSWLTAENIGDAIAVIISELPFPRLPSDPDWHRAWTEWRRAEYERQQEIERQKRIEAQRLAPPPPERTPEQKARIEALLKQTIANLSTAA